MFYKAVVLDNTQFYSKGTIRVRVAGFFQRKMDWNLAENFPDFIEEGVSDDGLSSEDFEAYLMSPLGGGRNYGIFFLPQINEKGIVTFLGNNKRKPIWMGSFFEPEYSDEFDVSYVNIPSDSSESEGENSDGIIEEKANMNSEEEGDELNKNVVIRTKNTNKESAEEIDWEQQRTTNIAVLSNKELRLRHFSKDDGWDETTPSKWQEIIAYKNEEEKDEIKAEVKNNADKKTGTIKINEDKVNILIESEDTKTQIIGSLEEGFTVETDKKVDIVSKENVNVETEKDAYVKSQTAHFDVQKPADSFKVAGGGDSIVLYSQLKSLIEKVENHLHIAPSGPTTPPLNSDQSPIISQTTAPKIQMESKINKTD